MQLPCFLHLRVLSSPLSMGTEIPVCRLCHIPKMPRRKGDAWFWACKSYPTCTSPSTTNLLVPQNLKTLLLKQQIQAINGRIPVQGCRQLLVKPWANGTGMGNTSQSPKKGGSQSSKGEEGGGSQSSKGGMFQSSNGWRCKFKGRRFSKVQKKGCITKFKKVGCFKV